MGFGGPVGLRQDVALLIIERQLHDREDQDFCLKLVNVVYNEYLRRILDKDGDKGDK